MASHAISSPRVPVAGAGRFFQRALTLACVLMAALLFGAGLYLMAIGPAAAAQSRWLSGEVSSRMVGPGLLVMGLAFLLVVLRRCLRPVYRSTRESRARR